MAISLKNLENSSDGEHVLDEMIIPSQPPLTEMLKVGTTVEVTHSSSMATLSPDMRSRPSYLRLLLDGKFLLYSQVNF